MLGFWTLCVLTLGVGAPGLWGTEGPFCCSELHEHTTFQILNKTALHDFMDFFKLWISLIWEKCLLTSELSCQTCWNQRACCHCSKRCKRDAGFQEDFLGAN